MKPKYRCAHCRRLFVPNPRIKEQGYCRRNGCQQARKKLWQCRKMARDPDYKANHRNAQKSWQEQNRDYWRLYRRRNPRYVIRNRLLQQETETRQRRDCKDGRVKAFRQLNQALTTSLPPGKGLQRWTR